jgi:hypothetical protein
LFFFLLLHIFFMFIRIFWKLLRLNDLAWWVFHFLIFIILFFMRLVNIYICSFIHLWDDLIESKFYILYRFRYSLDLLDLILLIQVLWAHYRPDLFLFYLRVVWESILLYTLIFMRFTLFFNDFYYFFFFNFSNFNLFLCLFLSWFDFFLIRILKFINFLRFLFNFFQLIFIHYCLFLFIFSFIGTFLLLMITILCLVDMSLIHLFFFFQSQLSFLLKLLNKLFINNLCIYFFLYFLQLFVLFFL